MKHRRFVIASALVMLGVAAAIAGVALYSNYSVKASATSLPDILNSIPSDYQFISGINVQRFVASPYYAKFRQNQTPALGSDLATFIEKTGVDPARDISHLVFAGASKAQGVAVVGGTFDQEKILAYIKSKVPPSEIEYAGKRVIIIPDKKGGDVQSGIVFLNKRQIAVGSIESLKSVLDTSTGAKKNILSNAAISSLVNDINPEEMIWFAGNASDLMAHAPATPLGTNISSIQSLFGALNITDAVVGKITATTDTAEAASKLTDVLKGFLALGQLSGNQNPDLKALLDGMGISQSNSQVTLSLNIPIELLEKFQRGGFMGRKGSGSSPTGVILSPRPAEDKIYPGGMEGVKSPVIRYRPHPPYTPEARNAHVEGSVALRLVVRKDGRVDNFRIIKGLGYGLDESAIQTVATKWQFEPGTFNGTPVDVQVNIEVPFRLSQ